MVTSFMFKDSPHLYIYNLRGAFPPSSLSSSTHARLRIALSSSKSTAVLHWTVSYKNLALNYRAGPVTTQNDVEAENEVRRSGNIYPPVMLVQSEACAKQELAFHPVNPL